MVWINLNVVSHDLHNVAKAYVNAANAIIKFFDPTPPTNITTNETIMTQYSIKQGLKGFGKKRRSCIKKDFHHFHDRRVVDPKKPHDF